MLSDPSASERSTDSERQSVLRQSISIGAATGAYGISFGALSVASGLSVTQTCLLSLLMFTGGSQFALVGVIAAGGTGAAAAAAAGMLGLRNVFYGLTLAPLLRLRSVWRPIAAHITIDESTAVATAQVPSGRRDLVRLGFWATGISVFVLWNLATLIGAYAGSAIGDPRQYGLDAAAAAAFLALLWPRLRERTPLAVALGAAALAAVLIPVAPPGIPVLASVVIALAAGWRVGRRQQEPA